MARGSPGLIPHLGTGALPPNQAFVACAYLKASMAGPITSSGGEAFSSRPPAVLISGGTVSLRYLSYLSYLVLHASSLDAPSSKDLEGT